MAKNITLPMLLAVKEERNLLWTWQDMTNKLPETRFRQFSNHSPMREFKLTCGGCNSEHWILWQELRKGRSSSCRTCSKAPTLKEMFTIRQKVGSFYIPTTKWKLKNGRRYIFMRCKCKRPSWVSWNRFQQGAATGCKSCMSPKRTHGLTKTYFFETWNSLLRRHPKRICDEWKDFVCFEEWAKPLYEPGWKLVRINRRGYFKPDNCDYMPISRKHIVIPSSEPALPMGVALIQKET